MFNRYTREGDTYVNIKQQPNDAADAARLHGEIRAKAEAEAARAIIDHFGAHNEIRVVKTSRQYAPACDEHITRALFTINGRVYDVNVAVESHLRDRVERSTAEAITLEILRQFRTKP